MPVRNQKTHRRQHVSKDDLHGQCGNSWRWRPKDNLRTGVFGSDIIRTNYTAMAAKHFRFGGLCLQCRKHKTKRVYGATRPLNI